MLLFAEPTSAQQKSRTVTPESFEALAARAQAAMDANQIPDAIRFYQRAEQMQPAWSEGWWHLGTLYFDGGHFPEARDAFVHFVSVEKKEPGPGFGMLGLAEFHLKHYSKALDALERGNALGLGTNPDFIHVVLYHDGILNTVLGQPEIALQRLTLLANQTAAAHPEAPKDAVLSDAPLLDAFGLAALHMGKLPSDIPAEKAAVVRKVGHAQALIALQDRVAAGEELKQAVALYASAPGVHYAYGVYLLKENPPLATDEFRREIEVSPSNYAARIQLALVWLGMAEYEKSLPFARKAVELAPRNFVAHVAYGRVLLELGKTDHAVAELRTAVALAPGSPDAHFALSKALSQAGRNGEAANERAAFERLKAASSAGDRQ